ncbi:MAG: helix-turn-helix domain-containing protein, partial [Candidatus Acidiferrum sp.]
RESRTESRRGSQKDRVTTMKLRPIQFGEHENTASPRQHASRLEVDPHSNGESLITEDPETPLISRRHALSAGVSETPLNAAYQNAATGKMERDEGPLLNVQEVAQLLQVPVSWVYERVRRRSLERLPAYRLGKYWRFREADIRAWIERQRMGTRFHA